MKHDATGSTNVSRHNLIENSIGIHLISDPRPIQSIREGVVLCWTP